MLPTKLKLMGGGVDFKIPNVSYCEDVKDVHFNPYNLIEFYVGEITGTTPQTVNISTGIFSSSIDVEVSKGNKWYSYVLPKDKGLSKIEGDSVKKVVIKADINSDILSIIPKSTVEASFKGSNTSNVTNMASMFSGCTNLTSLDVSSFNTSKVTSMNSMFHICTNLTSLDLSSFDTSKVTYMGSMFGGCKQLNTLNLSGWNTSNILNMNGMFGNCTALNTIIMVGCSEGTRTKIQTQLTTDGITGVEIIQ